ncbi:MAG: LD-carboxypeptidase [Bacteroidetes bacterium]|nr:LD-carboxypeptidase [Bacteroidota bacterium]MBU1678497.1 LD-carboxypeptidase [Bacteroidota bacterium]MBU2505200.1 LD-carboxypeptidase [Bacteroidota bacterium]
MNRREFVKSSAALSILCIPGLLNSKTISANKVTAGEIIKPKALKPGDSIGLVSPGSSIDEEELKDSITNIENLGYKVVYEDSILDSTGFLAGLDDVRADELNKMFARDDVDGIICARGGYGAMRIIPQLNYELIRKNTKVLLGYSDITALHFALYSQAGVVSFHGPVGISTFNEYSINYLQSVIGGSSSSLEFISSSEDLLKDNQAYQRYVINGGSAKGELVGGNLSIAAALIGTPYDVSYKNKIVYLEDIGEEPYRIDRMLTELLLAGKLQECSGIALGVFMDCEQDKEKPAYKNSQSLKEVFFDRLEPLKIPTVYGLSFGHISNKFTIPFGVKAELVSDNYKLRLLEKAVK